MVVTNLTDQLHCSWARVTLHAPSHPLSLTRGCTAALTVTHLAGAQTSPFLHSPHFHPNHSGSPLHIYVLLPSDPSVVSARLRPPTPLLYLSTTVEVETCLPGCECRL